MNKLLSITVYLCVVTLAILLDNSAQAANDVSPLDFLTVSKFDDKTNKDRVVKVKAGTFTSASGTGNQTVTGVGFRPRVLILGLGIGASDSIVAGLGWCTSDDQVAVFGFRSDDTDSGGLSTDATTVIRWSNAAGVAVGQASFVNFTPDGFILNWSAAEARTIGYLAIE